jgi:hypothetical protein
MIFRWAGPSFSNLTVMSRARVCAPAIAGWLVATSAVAASPTVPPDAPFTSAQLARALARRAEGRVMPALEIVYLAGRVEVRVVDRRVAVDLAGQAGVDAARVVALAILDALEPAPLPARGATPPAEPRVDLPTGAPAPAWEAPTLTLGVLGTMGTRAAVRGELGVRLGGRLWVVVDAGRASTATSGTLRLTRYPLHAAIATQLPFGPGAVEVRAGAAATIEHARATRTTSQTVFGAGVAVAYLLPVASPRVRLAATGGLDAYATARTYTIDSVTRAASDRLAWWTGVGLSVTVRP